MNKKLLRTRAKNGILFFLRVWYNPYKNYFFCLNGKERRKREGLFIWKEERNLAGGGFCCPLRF